MMDIADKNLAEDEPFQGTQELQFQEGSDSQDDELNKLDQSQQLVISDEEEDFPLPSPKRFCSLPEDANKDIQNKLSGSDLVGHSTSGDLSGKDSNEITVENNIDEVDESKKENVVARESKQENNVDEVGESKQGNNVDEVGESKHENNLDEVDENNQPELEESVPNTSMDAPEINMANGEGSEKLDLLDGQNDWCLQLTSTEASCPSVSNEKDLSNVDDAMEVDADEVSQNLMDLKDSAVESPLRLTESMCFDAQLPEEKIENCALSITIANSETEKDEVPDLDDSELRKAEVVNEADQHAVSDVNLINAPVSTLDVIEDTEIGRLKLHESVNESQQEVQRETSGNGDSELCSSNKVSGDLEVTCVMQVSEADEELREPQNTDLDVVQIVEEVKEAGNVDDELVKAIEESKNSISPGVPTTNECDKSDTVDEVNEDFSLPVACNTDQYQGPVDQIDETIESQQLSPSDVRIGVDQEPSQKDVENSDLIGAAGSQKGAEEECKVIGLEEEFVKVIGTEEDNKKEVNSISESGVIQECVSIEGDIETEKDDMKNASEERLETSDEINNSHKDDSKGADLSDIPVTESESVDKNLNNEDVSLTDFKATESSKTYQSNLVSERQEVDSGAYLKPENSNTTESSVTSDSNVKFGSEKDVEHAADFDLNNSKVTELSTTASCVLESVKENDGNNCADLDPDNSKALELSKIESILVESLNEKDGNNCTDLDPENSKSSELSQTECNFKSVNEEVINQAVDLVTDPSNSVELTKMGSKFESVNDKAGDHSEDFNSGNSVAAESPKTESNFECLNINEKDVGHGEDLGLANSVAAELSTTELNFESVSEENTEHSKDLDAGNSVATEVPKTSKSSFESVNKKDTDNDMDIDAGISEAVELSKTESKSESVNKSVDDGTNLEPASSGVTEFAELSKVDSNIESVCVKDICDGVDLDAGISKDVESSVLQSVTDDVVDGGELHTTDDEVLELSKTLETHSESVNSEDLSNTNSEALKLSKSSGDKSESLNEVTEDGGDLSSNIEGYCTVDIGLETGALPLSETQDRNSIAFESRQGIRNEDDKPEVEMASDLAEVVVETTKSEPLSKLQVETEPQENSTVESEVEMEVEPEVEIPLAPETERSSDPEPETGTPVGSPVALEEEVLVQMEMETQATVDIEVEVQAETEVEVSTESDVNTQIESEIEVTGECEKQMLVKDKTAEANEGCSKETPVNDKVEVVEKTTTECERTEVAESHMPLEITVIASDTKVDDTEKLRAVDTSLDEPSILKDALETSTPKASEKTEQVKEKTSEKGTEHGNVIQAEDTKDKIKESNPSDMQSDECLDSKADVQNTDKENESDEYHSAMIGSFVSPVEKGETSPEKEHYELEKTPVLEMPKLGLSQVPQDPPGSQAEAFTPHEGNAKTPKGDNMPEISKEADSNNNDESGDVEMEDSTMDFHDTSILSIENPLTSDLEQTSIVKLPTTPKVKSVHTHGSLLQDVSMEQAVDESPPIETVKKVVGRKRPIMEEDSDVIPPSQPMKISPPLLLSSPERGDDDDKRKETTAAALYETPCKKICIDKGTTCIHTPETRDCEVQVSPPMLGDPASTTSNASGSSSEKTNKGTVQVITVVQRVITKKYIKEGKLVRTVVMEEEDDPIIENQPYESLSSPTSGSSQTLSSLPSSILSGELADVSSCTSKSTSSSSSGQKLAVRSASPMLPNFTSSACSPPSHCSSLESEHSPFLPRRWSSSLNLLSHATPERAKKSNLIVKKVSDTDESVNKMPPNEESFKLPKKDTKKGEAATPCKTGRKKKGVKFEKSQLSPPATVVKQQTQIPKGKSSKHTDPSKKKDSVTSMSPSLPPSAVAPSAQETKDSKSLVEVVPSPTVKSALHHRSSKNSSEAPMECDEIEASILEGPESSSSKSILPGMRVMARWVDGCYYSGLVQSQTEDGRWLVVYDDHQTRAMSETDIIVIPLLEVGQNVLVPSASGFYDTGIITGRYRQGAEVGYVVLTEDGVTMRFTRSDVVLSNEQADALMGNSRSRKSSAEVSLENIVEGKRRRPASFSPLGARPVTEMRKVSRVKKKPDPNVDSTTTDDASTDGPKTEPTKDVTPSTTEKVAKHEEKTPRRAAHSVASEQKTRTPKRKGTTASASHSRSTADEKNIAPLLPKGSTLFKDFSCLLSYAEKRPQGCAKDADFSSLDSEAELDTSPMVPFNKAHVKAQIESGGGTLLDKFEQTWTTQSKHVVLISGNHIRTIKYIQCLAAGIPCISHQWVKDCISVNRILPYTSYLLPAGYSIVSRSLIEWHSKNTVLQGMRILLVSASNDLFVDTWTPVLMAAKADIVRRLPLQGSAASSYNVDMIVSDPSCPTQVLRRAANMNIPVVSSEWIIQCLITGQRLKPDAHPKFRHSYKE